MSPGSSNCTHALLREKKSDKVLPSSSNSRSLLRRSGVSQMGMAGRLYFSLILCFSLVVMLQVYHRPKKTTDITECKMMELALSASDGTRSLQPYHFLTVCNLLLPLSRSSDTSHASNCSALQHCAAIESPARLLRARLTTPIERNRNRVNATHIKSAAYVGDWIRRDKGVKYCRLRDFGNLRVTRESNWTYSLKGTTHLNVFDVITCSWRPSHSSGVPICKAEIPSLRRSPTFAARQTAEIIVIHTPTNASL